MGVEDESRWGLWGRGGGEVISIVGGYAGLEGRGGAPIGITAGTGGRGLYEEVLERGCVGSAVPAKGSAVVA